MGKKQEYLKNNLSSAQSLQNALALSGRFYRSIIPRALLWADNLLAFQSVWRQKQIIIRKHWQYIWLPVFFLQRKVPFPSGAGRVRTAVQTSNWCAFYMLIPWLVFEAAPDADTQGNPYSLKFHRQCGTLCRLSRLYEHLLVTCRRSGPVGDVLSLQLLRGLSWPTVLRSGSKSVAIFAN